MDSIIIFDQKNTRKHLFSALKFSYDRAFSMDYVHNEAELKSIMLAKPQSLLYIIADRFLPLHRIIIRNIQKAIPTIDICLCSDANYALDAWKLNLFHFLEIPIVSTDFLFVYHKYINASSSSDKPSELKFKLKDGLVTVPYASICFVKASGNYSTIHAAGDKSYLQTKQLNKYMHLCEESSAFLKVHRSLILNMNRVNKLSNQHISFFQSEYKLEVSKTLESKIKKIILGR